MMYHQFTASTKKIYSFVYRNWSFIEKIFLSIVLIALLTISFPYAVWAESNLATITVDVAKRKANENGWDVRKGAPDIAICLTNELVGTMCLPKGDSIDTVREAECQNSYKCHFSALIPEHEFKVSVLDVDFALNDIIGVGHCRREATCLIGEASVKID